MIYSKYPLKVLQEVEPFPPIQNTDNPYLTEAAMHADQANQLEGYGYLVDGVGAFTYLGTLAGSSADYKDFGRVTETIKSVREINSNTTLSNTDNGLVIILTASCTVTIPNGLMANFECTLVTLIGSMLTISLGSLVELLNNEDTTMAEKLSVTLKNTLTSNKYLSVGNL